MAIDDTGDATEVQSPDVAPEPETPVVTRRPASGDGLVAAGLSQLVQNLNNQISWLKKPFAKASAWAGHIWSPRNARLHRGNVFNHQGILDGRIITIEEDWIDIDATDKGPAAATGPWFGRWNYGIFGQGGNVYSSPPSSLNLYPWGPRAGVTIIGSSFPFAQSAALIEMCRAFMLGGSAYIAMEAAISVNPNGAGSLEDGDTYSFGFSSGTLFGAAETGACDTGAMASNAGAYIVKKAIGGNVWDVISRPVGGGGAGTASVIANIADSAFRYRVEIMTAGAADDNAVHVIHYVNGAVVANHAIDMAGATLTPFIRTSGQYSGPNVHSVLNVGRIRLTGRLELGDVYP